MLYDPSPPRNDTPKAFKNPLRKAVTVEVFDDDNNPVTYTLNPLEMVTYPTYLADVLIKHVVDAVANAKDRFVSGEERAEIEKGIVGG